MTEAALPSSPVRSASSAQAEEAAAWAREGAAGQNKAARVLLRVYGGRLKRFFMGSGRVPEPEAEELVSEAIFNCVTGGVPRDCAAEKWLWAVARNELVDWARRKDAAKRGGAAEGGRTEVSLDADALLALVETSHGYVELAPWIRECVHKAAALMEAEDPRHAEVLRLKAQGWSAEEIAIFYGARPGKVSAEQQAAARDRAYRACLAARQYFEHCRE